jgi:hypothetical protein
VPFETTRKLDFYELHSEEFENGHFPIPKESTTRVIEISTLDF